MSTPPSEKPKTRSAVPSGKDPDSPDQVSDSASNAPQGEAARKAGALATLRDIVSELPRRIRGVIRERFVTNVTEFLDERQPLIWLLAIGIGITVGYVSIAFRWLIGLFQYPWLFTFGENVASAAAGMPWWVVILAPTTGGLIVGYILQHYMPGRRGQGVADVIEAHALHNARIDPKVGFLSAGLSALSIGTGASVGREGPIVHLGATIAGLVEDRFRLSPGARRTLFGCGVAAAVSASFNAPIAGVLFAHEVILHHYAFRALVPTILASVIGAVIARIHLGNYPAFIIPEYQITSYWEFPAFALLGVTCAFVAIIFELALMATERISWRFDMQLWLRCATGGFLVGCIGVFFPQVLGVGYEATDQALSGQIPLWLLFALLVAKTAATAISLSSRFCGGIFSPTLYLGAMTGAAFGAIATSVFPEIGSSDGLYAILGMGAVAGAVLGAPLSTTMIVFELTSGYAVTIALLLTVSIAVGLTQAVLGHSLFHWQLGKRGLFLTEGPHQAIMRRLKVSDFSRKLKDGEEEALPEKDEDGRPPVWLMQTDTLDHALRSFAQSGLSRLPVVDQDDTSKVIAWADRITALSAFNSALIEAHIEHHR